MILMTEALSLIVHEYHKALKKHPVWPESDPVHAINFLVEECGEAAKEANDLRWEGSFGAKGRLRTEVAQAGAVCVRMLMWLDNGGLGEDIALCSRDK